MPSQVQLMTKKYQKGHFYMESMIAVCIVALIGIPLIKNIKHCILTSQELIYYDQISSAAEYVGSYIFSWADNKDKPYSIESYSEGAYLNDMYDTRINQLQFAESPSHISDKLCVTIQLWDTTTRNDAAQVLAEVWYDKDLDRVKDSTEVSLSFSTIISEK